MGTLVDLEDYEKVFLGKCHAIALSRRSKEDPHVMITVLTFDSDDGNWYRSDTSFSSYWTPELMSVFKEATDWLNRNCGLYQNGWFFPGPQKEKISEFRREEKNLDLSGCDEMSCGTCGNRDYRLWWNKKEYPYQPSSTVRVQCQECLDVSIIAPSVPLLVIDEGDHSDGCLTVF
jgi:hypothetical protein